MNFDPELEVTYASFQRALNASARFIEWPGAEMVPHAVQDLYPLTRNTTIMLGVMWPRRHVAFPDFLDSSGRTQRWWADECVAFRQRGMRREAYRSLAISAHKLSFNGWLCVRKKRMRGWKFFLPKIFCNLLRKIPTVINYR